MQTKPKTHQIDAANAATGVLAEADRATIVMPCGTGKTLVGAMIANSLAPKALVMFFPSLALIKQTLQAWKYENPLGVMDYLCVCSDQTINDDEAHITLDELGGGDRVTTDPARIHQFMRDRSVPKILFSTYQSAAMIQVDEPIDLAIMDEAHRTAGACDNAYAVPLIDDYIQIRKRVFMTATPRHVASDENDKGVFSMLDESFYGKIAYAMSITEAIERGIICDYKIIVSVTTDADIAEIAEKHNTGKTEASVIAAAVAIRSAMDTHGVKKAISFHKTVQSASSFATDPNVTSILAAQMVGHVSGKQTSSKRAKTMASFRGASTGLVTNARCLTEGVDVPSVDMVAFLDRKDSIIDVVQACGRAMRIAEGKESGHILLPLHVNLKSGETIEQAVLRSGFREIWRVINSMREQDMIVAGGNGRLVSLKTLKKANQAAENRLEVIGSSSTELVDAIRDTVMAVSVKRLQNRSWEDSFDLLLEAREKHDTWEFGKADPELDFLDVWVETQKKSDRNKTLRAELKNKLAAIDFPFNKRQDENWGAGLQEYLGLVALGGSTSSRWADKQRLAYKNGKMPEERIKRLRDLGFEFDGLAARAKNIALRREQGNKEPENAHDNSGQPVTDNDWDGVYAGYHFGIALSILSGFSLDDAFKMYREQAAIEETTMMSIFPNRVSFRASGWEQREADRIVEMTRKSCLSNDLMSKMRFQVPEHVCRTRFADMEKIIKDEFGSRAVVVPYAHPNPIFWQFMAFVAACGAAARQASSEQRHIMSFDETWRFALFAGKTRLRIQFASGKWWTSGMGVETEDAPRPLLDKSPLTKKHDTRADEGTPGARLRHLTRTKKMRGEWAADLSDIIDSHRDLTPAMPASVASLKMLGECYETYAELRVNPGRAALDDMECAWNAKEVSEFIGCNEHRFNLDVEAGKQPRPNLIFYKSNDEDPDTYGYSLLQVAAIKHGFGEKMAKMDETLSWYRLLLQYVVAGEDPRSMG